MKSAVRTALTAVAATLLIFGCGGDDPSGPPEQLPEPGELRVSLIGNPAAGAVVLTVTGPGIGSPAPAGSASLYHDLSGNTLHAVIVGSSLSGEIVSFAVPDVRQVAGYQVALQQVAGTDNQTLDVASYSASVSVVP
jgi:hypothetical protein